MINQIKDVLRSMNIIEASDYPIRLYEEHVAMMQIKWVTSDLIRFATMDAVEHEIDHEGEALLEQAR